MAAPYAGRILYVGSTRWSINNKHHPPRTLSILSAIDNWESPVLPGIDGSLRQQSRTGLVVGLITGATHASRRAIAPTTPTLPYCPGALSRFPGLKICIRASAASISQTSSYENMRFPRLESYENVVLPTTSIVGPEMQTGKQNLDVAIAVGTQNIDRGHRGQELQDKIICTPTAGEQRSEAAVLHKRTEPKTRTHVLFFVEQNVGPV